MPALDWKMVTNVVEDPPLEACVTEAVSEILDDLLKIWTPPSSPLESVEVNKRGVLRRHSAITCDIHGRDIVDERN
jgi:hypothetical protein